jgi:DNA helicase II / ATP-dependent DNA helicase PcrA
MKHTEEQRAVIDDPHPWITLIAPAGSGKTATIAGRVAAIADPRTSIPGTKALALTFTNKAAAELAERTEGKAEAHTFHGFASRLRRLADHRPFTIYDETDRNDLAILVGRELGQIPREKDPKGRGRKSAADKVLATPSGKSRYRKKLRQFRAVDFDLLIEDAQEYARKPRMAAAFRAHHWLLDEQQDTDRRQWDIVSALQPIAVTMVGDPRQTIYSWRNALPEILLQRWNSGKLDTPMEPGSRRWHSYALTANFRSTPEIVSLANMIAAGMDIKAPPMVPKRGPVEAPHSSANIYTSDEAEAEAVVAWLRDRLEKHEPGKHPAAFVLARNWRSLDMVDELLAADGIEYFHAGRAGDFWKIPVVKAATRALALALNPWNDWIARTLADWPDAKISHRDILKAAEVAAREAEPLAFVLAAKHPEHFGFWDRGRMVVARRHAGDAGIMIAEVLREMGVPAAFMKTGRETKMAVIEELCDRVRTWTETQRAAELDTSAEAFLEWLANRQSADEAPSDKPIWLSTIHGVKGLEANNVALVGMHKLKTTDRKGYPDPETRRLFYVAATRARDRVLLTQPERTEYSPLTREAIGIKPPSPFWAEAARHLDKEHAWINLGGGER